MKTLSRAPREPITGRIARWSISHPWWAVGLWLGFVVAAVVFSGATETKQATDADLSVGESGRAERIIESAGFDDPDTDLVLITGRGQAFDPAAAQAAAERVSTRLERLPEVASVAETVASPTAEALMVPVELAAGDADDQIGAVIDEVERLDADQPELRIEAVGGAAIGHGIDEVVESDLGRAGMLSLPLTLAILLVVFGSLVAAGVPLLLGITAVAAATGLWAFVSHAVPDVGTVPQVILLIGLAVGVDYSLFYLKREREERQRGNGTVDAVRVAAATSGRAVVVSGLTSIVALAGLFLAGDAVFAALATGVLLAVAVAMVGSLTVLPAVLSKLGRAVDRPRVPVLWRLTMRGTGEPRVWRALLAPALRAPRTTAVVTLLLLLGLAAPALGMSLKNSTEEDLPRSIPVMQGYDRLLAAFPSQGHSHQVAVRAPAGQSEQVEAALTGLAVAASEHQLFSAAEPPPVRVSPDRTISVVELPHPYEVATPEAERSLTLLRSELLPAAMAAVPSAEYAVGGITADNVDYTRQQSQRMPLVIGFVILLTVGMMALAFRSVVVALVAGGLGLLSVAAAFGLLTLVFQNSWAEGLLGFTSTGHVVNWVPLFLFVVLFGLSMDYHVFVVSRIRDAASTGMPTREAVRVGITRGAGVVTSAAAVMVAVFSVFATLSLIEMKQLGVGLAAAVAIDAVLVRILLLPAIMNLLGVANWWPSRLGRRSSERTPAGAESPAGGGVLAGAGASADAMVPVPSATAAAVGNAGATAPGEPAPPVAGTPAARHDYTRRA